MKVGILTWYDVLNYGSVFQAYALQEQLTEFGIEAVILQHDRKLPDYYKNTLQAKSITGVLSWLRNQTPNRKRYRRFTKAKYESFESFRNENLKVCDLYSQTNSDVVLIGSDQIFDINGMYYPWQFGKGISCNRISTYAPSFGETTLHSLKDMSMCYEIEESIKALSAINARDENTRQILSEIRNEDVPIVLDPTLMYSFNKEKKMWKDRLIKEKYCLVYTWGGFSTSPEFAEQCNLFAKINNMKLVSVGEYRQWCDIQFATATPLEFFELFMHANMVLTNMFHGTCFSILMGRPFYSFVMPHNKNKLSALLTYLNLEVQIVDDPKRLPMAVPDIDYDSLNSRLAFERRKSINDLKRVINI